VTPTTDASLQKVLARYAVPRRGRAISNILSSVAAYLALIGAAAGAILLLVVVNLAKEKFGMALVGLLIPPVAAIGAVRLAKPHSLWARLYGEEKEERARTRFAG